LKNLTSLPNDKSLETFSNNEEFYIIENLLWEKIMAIAISPPPLQASRDQIA
jgi:hypothetical protein